MPGDDATRGAANERDLSDALEIEQLRQNVRERFHGVGSGLGGGVAESGQIDGQTVRALRPKRSTVGRQ